MDALIRWVQAPANGPLLHALAGLLSALISAGVGYATDPADPFKLGAPTLGLVGILGQALVSWLRNAGMVTVPADQVVPNSDLVIVATAGRKPADPPV